MTITLSVNSNIDNAGFVIRPFADLGGPAGGPGPFHGGSLDVGERAWHQYLRTGLKVDAPQARFF